MQNNLFISIFELDAVKRIFSDTPASELKLEKHDGWLSIGGRGTILWSENKELIKEAYKQLTQTKETICVKE